MQPRGVLYIYSVHSLKVLVFAERKRVFKFGKDKASESSNVLLAESGEVSVIEIYTGEFYNCRTGVAKVFSAD